ncbi:MAG: hypothetical protein HOL70_14990 [Candidatus Marinimicrobia bacterium]|nr:hypothetical protein [Candidatus Neomarinimicrobiota bacterium]
MCKEVSGKAQIICYADDWGCAFQHKVEAERFCRTLSKRLEKFSLEVAGEKANCLTFSRKELKKEERFIFLGFEFYWDQDRRGKPRVKRRTAPKNYRVPVVE